MKDDYPQVTADELATFFNLGLRTIANYKPIINMYKLHYVFSNTKELWKQKRYLYGLLSPKVTEDKLDNIWEKYILRLEYDWAHPEKEGSHGKRRTRNSKPTRKNY